MSDVTRILAAIEQGDARAADELLPLVYQELRHLAAPTDKERLIRFIRENHPFRIKKLERDLKVFEYQQIRSLHREHDNDS